MRETTGDLWTLHDQGHWICITTNGVVKRNGELVMGRGCALEAAQRFPDLPRHLGWITKQRGLQVTFAGYRIIAFPVKYHWKSRADLSLIKKSCSELLSLLTRMSAPDIYLPRPGCGNGRLVWADVKPVIAPLLDDRVIVVSR